MRSVDFVVAFAFVAVRLLAAVVREFARAAAERWALVLRRVEAVWRFAVVAVFVVLVFGVVSAILASL